LGNAPDAFSCGEVYCWYRPWRTRHFQIDCSCGQVPCPCWDKIKDYSESMLHTQLFEQLRLNYVIDSSKELCWIIDNNDWAAKNEIAVINVLVWKDPVSLAYSHWKRGQRINTWRKGFLNYYSRFLQTNLPFVSLSYNELVQDPSQKVKQLCKIVGMEYFPGKERFWEKHHHLLYGSGGLRKQLQQGVSEIKSQEIFSPEFMDKISELSEEIQGDTQVQDILRILKQSEVTNHSTKMSTLYTDSHLPDSKRPLWYYTKWLKRIYRKRFPQQFIQTEAQPWT